MALIKENISFLEGQQSAVEDDCTSKQNQEESIAVTPRREHSDKKRVANVSEDAPIKEEAMSVAGQLITGTPGKEHCNKETGVNVKKVVPIEEETASMPVQQIVVDDSTPEPNQEEPVAESREKEHCVEELGVNVNDVSSINKNTVSVSKEQLSSVEDDHKLEQNHKEPVAKTYEKEHCGQKHNANEVGAVFKKPVLLVGPRKGKTGGKLQVYKATDTLDNAERSKEPETDQQEEIGNVCISTVAKCESVKETVEDTNLCTVSPGQKVHVTSLPFRYKEPSWSGIPKDVYKFEVLKNGSIVEMIDLSSKSFFVFGRVSTCDILMTHPMVSRYHAVLQYRSDSTDGETGFYVYDLGSTHGTFLNKYRIKPNKFVRVQVGHILKLGGSSRMFILQGPEDDMEKESELSVTELKNKRKEQQLAKELQEIKELEEKRLQEEKEEKDGIDWGMGDDAEEETDLSENPYAAAPNEELYLDDPKKTLRGWFEREGYDLEYDVEEKGFGQFLCRIELPVENARGGSIIAEALVKGKKKEAVVQCALEACRILDRYGLLRQAKHESRKRKAKNWEENDFYDSDEDEFLDRTGAVEKKRQQRMKAAGKIQSQTDTYESLMKKLEEILSQRDRIQRELDEITTAKKKEPEIAEDEDELDAFMTNLSSEIPDIKLMNKLKSELLSLRKEEIHVRKLINIACPASLPKLIENPPAVSNTSSSKSRLQMGHSSKRNVIGLPSQTEDVVVKQDEDVNMEEEEEEEEEVKEKIIQQNTIAENVDSTNESTLQTGERPAVRDVCNAETSHKCTSRVEEEGSSEDQKDLLANNDKQIQENVGKNVKLIGPALPPEDFTQEEVPEKRKKRARQRQHKKTPKDAEGSSTSDPNYSMWVPPEGQSGDGKTKLNEKYGY